MVGLGFEHILFDYGIVIYELCCLNWASSSITHFWFAEFITSSADIFPSLESTYRTFFWNYRLFKSQSQLSEVESGKSVCLLNTTKLQFWNLTFDSEFGFQSAGWHVFWKQNPKKFDCFIFTSVRHYSLRLSKAEITSESCVNIRLYKSVLFYAFLEQMPFVEPMCQALCKIFLKYLLLI